MSPDISACAAIVRAALALLKAITQVAPKVERYYCFSFVTIWKSSAVLMMSSARINSAMMSAPKPRWAVPLYRAIIRASGHFDTQPLARILLGAPLLSAASKTKATDHDIAKLGEMSGKVCDEGQAIAGSALSGAVDELRRACTDELGSSPTRLDLVRSPLSFRGALLRQLRAARVAEANNSSEAVGDAGFALLLELGTACDLSERLIAPAPLRESSATERPPPPGQAESLVGAVLASDPLAARTRLHEHTWAFAPSVALVLDDGREGGVASAVVTNARSSLKLRHHDWMSAMVAPLGGVFSEVPVYYGGDASLRTLTMLHPHGESLAGSRRVTERLYEGGTLFDAAQLVRCAAYPKRLRQHFQLNQRPSHPFSGAARRSRRISSSSEDASSGVTRRSLGSSSRRASG